MKNTRSYIGIIAFSFALFLAGCGSNDVSGDTYDNSYEVSNPYSEGTGHYAGYEWAERTGGDCEGNSTSFNEGCEEYYSQMAQ